MTHEDHELLRAIRANRDWAMHLVAEAITPLIKSKLFSFSEWEDVRQQCLLNIVVALREIDRVHNFWGLVRKIAICHVIDHNRRIQLTRSVFADRQKGDGSGDDIDPIAAAVDRKSSPEEQVANEDLFLYVYQRLEETCQKLFYLVFLRGRSYVEASRELQITEGNLRVRLKRCRDKAVELRDQSL